MQRLVVLIVDSQPIFRAGVRRALSHQNGLYNLEILDCDPGKEGEEAIRQIAENSPDVALIDVNYPSVSGLELSRYITRHFPATKVVMLSANHNAEELVEVIKTGAAAYLSKDSSAEELLEAIGLASSGQYPINGTFRERPRTASRVLEHFQDMVPMDRPGEATISPLTPKEIQFLNLIAEENSNRQIATILGISEQAIRGYVSAILRKLNASDRAHAVMLELCNYWLSIQERVDASRSEGQISKEPVQLEQSSPAKRSTKGAPKAQRRSSSRSAKAAVPLPEAQDRLH